jgi:protein-tyrosine phosphatase
MIDLHTHILPGLDHGPGDWDEALEMCRIAVADGITTIAATPHVSEVFPNSSQRIEAAVDELRLRLGAAGIPLAVVVGGDYHIRPDLSPRNVLTLGGNGRYFLLEFPYQIIPPHADAFIRVLVERGLLPIVTHPERTASLQRDWHRLEPLVKEGALVQITAGSLLGEFGPAATAAANRFLKKGWVHLLASDAHWARSRSPRLAGGRVAAAKIVGEVAAQALVDQNPRAILEGRDLRGTGDLPAG